MTENDLKWCKKTEKPKRYQQTDGPTDGPTNGQSGLQSRVHATKKKSMKGGKRLRNFCDGFYADLYECT